MKEDKLTALVKIICQNAENISANNVKEMSRFSLLACIFLHFSYKEIRYSSYFTVMHRENRMSPCKIHSPLSLKLFAKLWKLYSEKKIRLKQQNRYLNIGK